jgi:hypothetical protein
MTATSVFARVPSKHIYLARIDDVPGIVYVVEFVVEFNAETPCVNVWFVPAVLVTHNSTTLPTV